MVGLRMDSGLDSKQTHHSGSLGTHWSVPGLGKLRLKGGWGFAQLSFRKATERQRWGFQAVLSAAFPLHGILQMLY